MQICPHWFHRSNKTKQKTRKATPISCKLNADSIYICCDLHPVSSMRVNRKQMQGIVLSLNSSGSDCSQHRRVRPALYLHVKRCRQNLNGLLGFPLLDVHFLTVSMCVCPSGQKHGLSTAGSLPDVHVEPSPNLIGTQVSDIRYNNNLNRNKYIGNFQNGSFMKIAIRQVFCSLEENVPDHGAMMATNKQTNIIKIGDDCQTSHHKGGGK